MGIGWLWFFTPSGHVKVCRMTAFSMSACVATVLVDSLP